MIRPVTVPACRQLENRALTNPMIKNLHENRDFWIAYKTGDALASDGQTDWMEANTHTIHNTHIHSQHTIITLKTMDHPQNHWAPSGGGTHDVDTAPRHPQALQNGER